VGQVCHTMLWLQILSITPSSKRFAPVASHNTVAIAGRVRKRATVCFRLEAVTHDYS
jgi:hypothetical protein